MEIYREIKNYEGLYEVSNLGNVRSLYREYIGGYGAVCHTGGKLLKLHFNKYRDNRVTVILCKDGCKKSFYVSVLVAKAFPEICGNWYYGCEVDHIDTDTTNNNATNLRCLSKKENMSNPLTKKHLIDSMTEDRVKALMERMLGDNNPARRCMNDTWRENMSKVRKGRKNTKCYKAVIIMKADEERYMESLTAAAKFIGCRVSDIGSVLSGRQSATHGWKIKYAN